MLQLPGTSNAVSGKTTVLEKRTPRERAGTSGVCSFLLEVGGRRKLANRRKKERKTFEKTPQMEESSCVLQGKHAEGDTTNETQRKEKEKRCKETVDRIETVKVGNVELQQSHDRSRTALVCTTTSSPAGVNILSAEHCESIFERDAAVEAERERGNHVHFRAPVPVNTLPSHSTTPHIALGRRRQKSWEECFSTQRTEKKLMSTFIDTLL